MKFLVLALCVYAASAASFSENRPWQTASARATVGIRNPVVQVSRTVVPVVQPIVPITKPVVPVVQTVEPVKPVQPVVVAAVRSVGGPYYTGAVAKSSVSHGQEWEAPILRSEANVHPEGFNYVYETGNGIAAEASGVLKKIDNVEAVAVQGSYKYTAPDGTPVQVTYIADENGYQPQSDLLPVAPAIPEAILRSLRYISEHPQQVEINSNKKF